ncbi:ARHGAP19 family protein [Megaselia abdita]
MEKRRASIDMAVAERMKSENSEKFISLCRMHLSFELDLNTDEFDLPCNEIIYFEKGKQRKWSRMPKKLKGNCTQVKTGSPIDPPTLKLTNGLVEQLKKLKDFIMDEKNIIQEGVFRKTGSVSRQNELRSNISRLSHIDLNNDEYTVHDCSTVYKSFLSELPEPVLTDAHYPAHLQIATICNELNTSSSQDEKKVDTLISSLQLLLWLLPDENRILLKDVIGMLHEVVKHENVNKMTADNLATLFTPHLICPRNLPPEIFAHVSQFMSGMVSYMVTKGPIIFYIPARLATDIRADFFERKRKMTMSPEKILDESISDISTVNTVYTFVDREKTAAAVNTNTTDTELAQLYAHIQSLPESSKKRRLIKQFNKQNGQGTPLQHVNRKKSSEHLLSAKSIGDSIKKHIFNKNLISRTPKQNGGPPSAYGTPNNSGMRNPKMRVLFQTPISSTSRSNPSACPATPTLKKSNLLKSISSSSSSLLTSDESSNDSQSLHRQESVSAPVSRQSSDVLEEKKTVMWNEDTKFHIHPNESDGLSIKSATRTKSEPNLSRILIDEGLDDTMDELKSECIGTVDETTPIIANKSKSITRKLIKGVSMGNLRFPFTPENTKRLLKSATSGRRSQEDRSYLFINEDESDGYSMENRDIITPKIQVTDASSEEEEEEEEEHQEYSSVYKYSSHLDLLTSTPSSFLLGRRSMSPITKSTQRMSKAMQESIMTPGSRKPVMLNTTLGSSEQNQTLLQSDLSSFREQDEDEGCDFEGLTDPFKRQENPDIPAVEEFEEESRLSSSLLYCLDGNEPAEEEKELSFSQFNSRKRSLPFKDQNQDNKENLLSENKNENSESYPKKSLVVQDGGAQGDVSV